MLGNTIGSVNGRRTYNAVVTKKKRQTMVHKTENCTTRMQLKTGGKLRMISSSCSTSDTRLCYSC